MEDKPTPTKKGNPAARERRLKHIKRFREVQKTIPKALRASAGDPTMVKVPAKIRKQWEAYAWLATGLNRRMRARVHYPWIAKPADPARVPEAHVKRGNPRRNPTALV